MDKIFFKHHATPQMVISCYDWMLQIPRLEQSGIESHGRTGISTRSWWYIVSQMRGPLKCLSWKITFLGLAACHDECGTSYNP
mmetsp:Transcript_13987/g.30371  ORF Transcript_13987/g.30371 Transcript_13987/m.30371 type:complete len:83 (-) Transcript_13987:1457-1705(-)